MKALQPFNLTAQQPTMRLFQKVGKQIATSTEALNVLDTARIDYDDLVNALRQIDERDDVIVTVVQGKILLVF